MVAKQATAAKHGGAPQFKFGKVKDLKVEQHELRPGARGRLWYWTQGKCEELKHSSIADKVKFHAKNISEAAKQLAFQDKRSIQMITDTGVTHGTANFPLTSYASRNHQGAAKFPGHITSLIKTKIKEKHMVRVSDAHNDGIGTIPFLVVPMNGTEQKLKPEMYEAQQHGLPWDPNVRPTYDGSSPHDGGSPNEHCTLWEDENKEWVSIRYVINDVRILMCTGAEIMGFKIDLRKA